MLRSMGILLLALGPATLLADDFNYTYIEAGYFRTDIDVDEGDGFALSGSYAITEDWHIFAGYTTAGFDFDIDLNGFDAGIGFNTSLSEKIDLVADIAYVYAEADTPFGTVDDNGIGLGVGVRAHASDSVELNFGISYSDATDNGQTSLNAGALFSVTERFAVRLAGSWDDDVNSYLLSGRIYF